MNPFLANSSTTPPYHAHTLTLGQDTHSSSQQLLGISPSQQTYTGSDVVGIQSDAATLTFGPAAQLYSPIGGSSNSSVHTLTFGPNSSSHVGLGMGEDLQVGQEEQLALGNGDKKHGSKRPGRVRMPGSLAGGAGGMINDDFTPSVGLQSPLYSSTAPATFGSRSLGAPAAATPDTLLHVSLTAAREDLHNPAFLSSSSARASVSDARYLSVPSNPSPYASHPTNTENGRYVGRGIQSVSADENINPELDGGGGSSRSAKVPRYQPDISSFSEQPLSTSTAGSPITAGAGLYGQGSLQSGGSSVRQDYLQDSRTLERPREHTLDALSSLNNSIAVQSKASGGSGVAQTGGAGGLGYINTTQVKPKAMGRFGRLASFGMGMFGKGNA